MGMSASQVRFLSLQSRKNDITRQLSTLSNKKMSLSRDMNKVSKNYTNALNQRLLKWSNDSGSTYNTLTYNLMMRPNDYNFTKPYILTKPSTGEVVLNSDALNLEQYDLTPTEASLNYKKLATYISSFIGVDDNGKVLYTTDGQPLNFDADSNSTNATNIVTDADGKIHGGKLKDGAQFITNDKDFSFKSNVRYDIYLKMGLITDEDYHKQVQCLTALYGTQEAKDTGIYPVGSAWGDYYLAQANLESYDNYLSTETETSNSGYTKGRGSKNRTYKDPFDANANTSYTYTTDVYSGSTEVNPDTNDNGSSHTVQTNSGNGTSSESHVNFKALVTTSGDGQYIYGEKGVTTKTNDITGETQDKIYTDNWATVSKPYNETDTINDGGIVRKTTISENGMKYVYNADDLIMNGIETLGLDTASADEDKQLKEATPADIAKMLQNGGGVRMIDSRKANGFNDDYIKEGLNNVLDSFVSILQANTILDLTNSDAVNAMDKAKTMTFNRIYGQRALHKTGCDHDSGKMDKWAKEAAENVGIAGWRKPDGRPGWSNHKTAVAMDLNVVYNTFMTYFNYYYNNPSNTANRITSSPTVPSVNGIAPETESTNPPTKYIHTVDGTRAMDITDPDLYKNNTMNSSGTVDSTVKVRSMDRTFLTSDIREAEDPDSAQVVDSVTTGTAPHTTTINYYASKRDEALNYFVDASGNTKKSQSMSVNGSTYTVYGTVMQDYDRKTATYYLLSESAVNDYISNGRLTGSDVLKVDTTATTSSADTATVPLGNDHDLTNAEIIIDNNMVNSKYDIKVDDYIKEDSGYRDKLVEKVNKAKERIDDLEKQMENIYSGSNKKLMDFYDALFERIAENGWTIDENTSSNNRGNKASTYLNNKLQNNDYFIAVPEAKIDSNGYNYTSKMAQSVTKIYTVNDENEQNSALSKYEADKNLISSKENKIDLIMQKLETEQEAINTEMESVKKIENENIEKTFKIFA